MIRSRFTDDLDGSAAEGTVRFGLDGFGYEIDLNAGHAKELQRCAGPVPRCCPPGPPVRPRASPHRPPRPAGDLNAVEVREWARAEAIEVKIAAGYPLTW